MTSRFMFSMMKTEQEKKMRRILFTVLKMKTMRKTKECIKKTFKRYK